MVILSTERCGVTLLTAWDLHLFVTLSCWIAFTLIRVVQSFHMSISCFTCHTRLQQPNMKTYSADVVLVTFISLSLLLLTFEANVVYNPVNNNTTICHSGFMSVYISKVQFADLPFTVYVHGKMDTLYNISSQCWEAMRWMYLFHSCLCPLLHRWTWQILPSSCDSKTVPLLLRRNWRLYNFNSCCQWMFCEKTSKLECALSL